jgi:hypothetical protein
MKKLFIFIAFTLLSCNFIKSKLVVDSTMVATTATTHSPTSTLTLLIVPSSTIEPTLTPTRVVPFTTTPTDTPTIQPTATGTLYVIYTATPTPTLIPPTETPIPTETLVPTIPTIVPPTQAQVQENDDDEQQLVATVDTMTQLASTTNYDDKLDPFFRDRYDEVMQAGELVINLCFWNEPDDTILQQIEAQVITMEPIGTIQGNSCWIVNVRLPPQTVPIVSQFADVYKVILQEPNLSYPKIDGQAQFLAKYKPNHEKLDVFVYMEKEVSQSRLDELQAMGVTLYPDSWIPPVGVHPNGYYSGNILVSEIVTIAKMDDIVQINSVGQRKFSFEW